MSSDADAITQAVLRAVRNGPLSDRIQDVQVEQAVDEDDEEFLRVSLLVDLPDEDVDSDLENLLERIEEAVSAIDPRYASVRFLDAA